MFAFLLMKSLISDDSDNSLSLVDSPILRSELSVNEGYNGKGDIYYPLSRFSFLVFDKLEALLVNIGCIKFS